MKILQIFLLSLISLTLNATSITIPRSVGNYFADVNDSTEKLGTVGQVQLQSDINKSVIKGQPSTWLVVADPTSSNNGYWWWDGNSLYQAGNSSAGLSLTFPCEALGFSTSNTPSANATILQNCLNTYANVSITTPGVYSYNWGQYIKSNKYLYIGNSVILQQYAAPSFATTSQNFLRNANVNATPVTTTNNTTVAAIGGGNAGSMANLAFSGGVLPVDNFTSATIAVGGYLQITGDTTNQWNNIWQVACVNNTASTTVTCGSYAVPMAAYSVSFAVNGQSTGTGVPIVRPSMAGTTGLRVVAADYNITITGGGTIDQNGAYITCPNSAPAGSALGGHGIILDHVGKVNFNNISIINSCNYGIDTANIFDSIFENIYWFNVKAGIQNDGVFRNIVLKGFSGQTYDDTIAFIASGGTFTGYTNITLYDTANPLNGSPNNTGVMSTTLMNGIGLTVRDYHMVTTQLGRMIQVNPDQVTGGISNVVLEDMTIDATQYTTGQAINESQIQFNQASQSTKQSYLADVTIRNVSGTSIQQSTYVTIGDFQLDGLKAGANWLNQGFGQGDGTGGLIIFSGVVTKATINDLNLPLNVSSATQPIIVFGNGTGVVAGNGIVNTLTLSNIYTNSPALCTAGTCPIYTGGAGVLVPGLEYFVGNLGNMSTANWNSIGYVGTAVVGGVFTYNGAAITSTWTGTVRGYNSQYTLLNYQYGGQTNNVNIVGGQLDGYGEIMYCPFSQSYGTLNVVNFVFNGYDLVNATCASTTNWMNFTNVTFQQFISGEGVNSWIHGATHQFNFNLDNIVFNASGASFFWTNGSGTAGDIVNINAEAVQLNSSYLIKDGGANDTYNLYIRDFPSAANLFQAKGTTPTINVSVEGIMSKPAVASGFGTGATVVTGTTDAFTINVGTGGTANTGIITMPASVNGWTCAAINSINPSTSNTIAVPTSATSITLQNYSRTAGTLTAWAASDVITVSCNGY